ncbi:TPA: RHS repeat protein [Klebsiella quasipneumoniae subsp. similipneumoniae]|nr:RHS repeat protein [Klebsiella quasipneumoniae subsp. similipneumoniae]
MSEFNAQLYDATPSVTVMDPRGRVVRQLEFYRQQVGDTAQRRITYQTWNSRGERQSVTDPRLATTTKQPGEVADYDLAGNVIKTHSTDSGTTVKLLDAAGRALLVIDAAGNKRTFTYDPVNGNLLQRKEKRVDGSEIITDDYTWAGYSEQEKAHNLGGALIRQYDSAGCSQLESVSLTGQPLLQTRQLLADSRLTPDWREDNPARESQLAETRYTTRNQYNTLGEFTALTDAGGNRWRYARDLNGRLQRSWLTLFGKTEHPVVTGVEYAANGQKQRESQANGGRIDMSYEPDTLRLSLLSISNSLQTLQELAYVYDPVGNILSITDKTQAPRYWNNQRTEAQRTFHYDTLYQLVEASGRELASNTRDDVLPMKKLSRNTPEYVNYKRTYRYDAAGNLIQLRHSGADSYTRTLDVAVNSNRAVYAPAKESLNVDDYFDVYGNQLNLRNGITLGWNSHGELQQATWVARGANSDGEYYTYDGEGKRVQKLITLYTNQQVNQETVCYLPGLEIHQKTQGGVVKEAWQVVSDPMTSGIRALCWSAGLPEGIENDQLRYSYQDIISSVILELDEGGDIISQEEYFPFGGTSGYLAVNEVTACYKTRRYSGKERDATGLYYYGYRYYNPEVGRWVSADPLGLAVGINRYAFVRNNPVNSRDVAGLVREEDLSTELLGAIGAILGRTDAQYGSELFSRLYWGAAALDDMRINPFAAEIDRAATDTHAVLMTQSREQGLLDNLSQDDVDAINLYSQQSLPFHSVQRYANSNFEFEWDKNSDGSVKQTYPLHYAGALENALERIPAFTGKSYRGALLAGAVYRLPGGYTPTQKGGRPLQVINVGDYVSTITYFSTSGERKVASEFALRQRFGNSFEFDTVVYEIEGVSGRNITELTHIQQAEILISPGAVFEVSDISRGTYGVSVKLREIDADRAWSSGRDIRDYRFGYKISARPIIPRE